MCLQQPLLTHRVTPLDLPFSLSLFLNVYFSYNISWLQYFLPSLIPVMSTPSLSPRSTAPLFLFRKEQASQWSQPNTSDINLICGKKKQWDYTQTPISRLDKATSRRKMVPSAGKRVKDTPTPTLTHFCGVPQKLQASIHNIYTEDLVQTPSDPCIGCFSLCESICALLSWFSGPCSSGVLHHLWVLQSLHHIFPGGWFSGPCYNRALHPLWDRKSVV